jgi:hypothetical protein
MAGFSPVDQLFGAEQPQGFTGSDAVDVVFAALSDLAGA